MKKFKSGLFTAHMARARLRDRHQENLRHKLQVLKAEQAVAAPSEIDNERPSTSRDKDHLSDNEGNDEEAANDLLNEFFTAYQSGGYSPKFLNAEELEPGTIVITEEDDDRRLEFTRMRIVQGTNKAEVCFVIYC